ncbi:unnamed protein product [Rhizoctonia solani]|uniref:Uncharacterized protein n=1 Tax=Rhizoctonia solani TaxID=456999 RepID=A0A8H3GSS4_9AGAM|nr:unnamed protein product [Rhizoctonia solani]
MQNLRSVLKLVQYPKAYRHLARSSAIRGCIKLMSEIKLNGKHSPFSYEYGYLCFRVVTIVLGICILHRSDRLDASIGVMEEDVPMNPQHDIIQHMGHHVSSGIFVELRDKRQGCLDSIFGWARGQSPLVVASDIELLSTMLWDDRKVFFRALRSTYHPGISSVVFVLWQINLREQNAIKSKFHSTVLSEISFRYNLIATSDQLHAVTYMNIDLLSQKYLSAWQANTEQVDLEDCGEVIFAYIDRFKSPHPVLHAPILVLHGPIFLRSLAQFVTLGTADLLPAVLEVTVQRIWEEIKDPSEQYKPDVFVDSIRDTFVNYTMILQNRVFRIMDHDLFQGLIDVVIEYDLIDLAARAILMLELPSEPPTHKLGVSQSITRRTG